MSLRPHTEKEKGEEKKEKQRACLGEPTFFPKIEAPYESCSSHVGALVWTDEHTLGVNMGVSSH